MDDFRRFARERLAAEMKALEEKKMTPIHKTHEHDVLCGRGYSVNQFPGNVYFRELVGSLMKDFVTTSTATEKSSIAKDILRQIKERDPPGRFLRRKEQNSEVWHEIPDKGKNSALKKIGQALRDRAAELKEGELEDSMDGNKEPSLLLGDISCDKKKSKEKLEKKQGTFKKDTRRKMPKKWL